MSRIDGVGNTGPIRPAANQPVARPAGTEAAGQARAAYKLELSDMSRLLASLKNDMRTEKVAEIKKQIDAGTYETPEKLDAAVDALLEDLTS